MKQLIAFVLLTLLVSSCSLNQVKDYQKITSERKPSGIILSNHGNSISENSKEILSDLKISGCVWEDNEKLIHEYKLEKIAKTIFDFQHSLFGFSLLGVLEQTPICFTDQEFNSKVVEANTHKIFKPQQYENRIVAINAKEIIVINQKLFNKMPFTNKQLLLIHEASHLKQSDDQENGSSDNNIRNTNEFREMSVKGLVLLIDKLIKSPTAVSVQAFSSQLRNGLFYNSCDNSLNAEPNYKLWKSISDFALNNSLTINFENFENNNIYKEIFAKTINQVLDENTCYSKLKTAFEIFQNKINHFRRLDVVTNDSGFYDTLKLDSKTIKLMNKYSSYKRIELKTKQLNVRAYFYILLSSENEGTAPTLINHIEYYKSDSYTEQKAYATGGEPEGVPIKSAKIFPESEEASEVYLNRYNLLQNSAMVLFKNEIPYVFFATSVSQEIIESTVKEKNNVMSLYLLTKGNVDYLLACDSNQICSLFNRNIKFISNNAGISLGAFDNARPSFVKVENVCVPKFSNIGSCWSSSVANTYDCLYSFKNNTKDYFTFKLNLSDCSITNYDSKYNGFRCNLFVSDKLFEDTGVELEQTKSYVLSQCSKEFSKENCLATKMECSYKK